jgi:hypothetical protein
MLPFKANYSYKLRMSIILKQIKKRSKIAKKRLNTLINIYIDFYKSAKLV